ncbi:M protein, serotype 5 like [Heracleum sosnowskyi]|uniref:M protein, serotype 5 like n=1 Tax=Heracleum sosnowskyi TaxID=360622 RepID=A0AAD8MW77_9APIA|nr:M protein, serotype 5 like [Heracleum sosnowskyi]
MSLTTKNLLKNPQIPSSFHIKNQSLSPSAIFIHFPRPPHNHFLKTHFTYKSLYTFYSPIRAFESDNIHIHEKQENLVKSLDFDAFLSVAEFLCLIASVIISFGLILNSQKLILVWLGNKVSVCQFLLLAGGILIGGVIRRRQWRRVFVGFSKPRGSGVSLIDRIEKLEEDVRSSATLIRVMSRHVEKLGTRFRVTRKALKVPIAEAAALAQKNSEATRALAVQEDILEKELGEMQQVLLAMQEQQQKQLELILAIAKGGKLLDSRRGPCQDQDIAETHKTVAERVKQESPKSEPF